VEHGVEREAWERVTGERPLRALLLDFDGTVADTQGVIFQCFRETVRDHLGFEASREQWEQCVGLPIAEIFSLVLPACERSTATTDLLVESYRARMGDVCEGITAFPQVPEVLEELHERGVRLALVTTKLSALVRRHLEMTGLAGRFEAVVCGDHCENCKPHPEPFLRALDLLEMRPEEAAGVGDSQYDVQSARAAGVLTAAACWGATSRAALLSARPDVVLEEPRQLLTLPFRWQS
jgi:pyrophosphatase PpaX